MSEKRLFIVGGNENKEDTNSLLKYFVDLAGEKKAKIAVLPTASREVEEKGENYRLFFSELGAGRVDVLKIEERRDADRKSVVEAFDNITGVFFTGGDQLRLTSIIAGTRLNKKLHERFEKGLLIGGTSAGASIMSDIELGNFEDLKNNILKNNPEVKKEYTEKEPLRQIQMQIVEARIKKGLSQKELADLVGTTQSVISRLESGDEYNPSLKTINKIVRALDKKMNISLV